MGKIQNSRQNLLGHLELEIGIYLGFGICQSEFAIATLRSPETQFGESQIRRSTSGYENGKGDFVPVMNLCLKIFEGGDIPPVYEDDAALRRGKVIL